MFATIDLILFLTIFVSSVVGLGNSTNSTTCLNVVNAIKNLLHPDRYDKALRPCENGEPVVVRVGLYIVSINNIKESDMVVSPRVMMPTKKLRYQETRELDIQVYFRQTWRDPRLSYDGLNITDKEYIGFSPGYVWDKIWLPDAYIENEKAGKIHTIMRTNQFLRLYRDGTVYYSTRLTLTVSCPMDFYDFPMDHQKCYLLIMSYGHTTKDIIYQWMTNKAETTVYKNEIVIPQFDIEEIETSSHIGHYTVGDFNVLTVYFHLHRRIEFYLIHNYIPAILVVVISWMSFWVDRDCAPARVGMGITTILTMTTLLIGVGQQDLPMVSYVKALDCYYIGCFIFVFVGLCEYSIVNYFSTKHKTYLMARQLQASQNDIEKVARDYDDASSEQAPSDMVKDETKPIHCRENYGFDFGSTDSVFHSPQSSCEDDEPEVKKEKRYDGVSMLRISDMIENCMRTVYPILFIIFNILYWLTYRKSILR